MDESESYSSDFEYICTYCMDSIYDVLFLCSKCVKFILCKQCVVHGVELGEHVKTHGLKPVDLGNYVLFDLSGIPQRQWKVTFFLEDKNNKDCPKRKKKHSIVRSNVESGSKANLKSILKKKLSYEEQLKTTISPDNVKYHNIFLTICQKKSQKSPEEFIAIVKRLNRFIREKRAKAIEKIKEKKQLITEAILRGDDPKTIDLLRNPKKSVFKMPKLPKQHSKSSKSADDDIRRSSRIKEKPKGKRDHRFKHKSLDPAKNLKVKIRVRKRLNKQLSSCVVVQRADKTDVKEVTEKVTRMEIDPPPKGKKKITIEKRVTRSRIQKKTKDQRPKRNLRKGKDASSEPRKIISAKQRQSVKQKLVVIKNQASQLKQRMRKTKRSISRTKRSWTKIRRAINGIDSRIIQRDVAEIEKELTRKNIISSSLQTDCRELRRRQRKRKTMVRKQRPIPKGTRIVTAVDRQWRAWEEMQLLDAIEKFGYGNWRAIAEEMQDEISISAPAVAEHYFTHYVLFDLGDCTLQWKQNSSLIRKMLDRQSMFRQRVPDLSSLVADTEHNFKFNYKPKRDDFEPDIEPDFETVVANMLPDTEDVTKLDMKLQIAHLEMYKLVIRDRQYAKYIIREYELLRKFMFQYPRRKFKISDSDRDDALLEVGSFKVFLRFASREFLQKLYLSLHKEFFMKLMIRSLLRFKNLGLSNLDQLIEYQRRQGQTNNVNDRMNLLCEAEKDLLAQDYDNLRAILGFESTEEQEIYIEQILPYLLGKMEANFLQKLVSHSDDASKQAKRRKFAIEERLEQWMNLAGVKDEVDEEFNSRDGLKNHITKQEAAACRKYGCSPSQLFDLKALLVQEYRSCANLSAALVANQGEGFFENLTSRHSDLLNSIGADIGNLLGLVDKLKLNSEN